MALQPVDVSKVFLAHLAPLQEQTGEGQIKLECTACQNRFKQKVDSQARYFPGRQ